MILVDTNAVNSCIIAMILFSAAKVAKQINQTQQLSDKNSFDRLLYT